MIHYSDLEKSMVRTEDDSDGSIVDAYADDKELLIHFFVVKVSMTSPNVLVAPDEVITDDFSHHNLWLPFRAKGLEEHPNARRDLPPELQTAIEASELDPLPHILWTPQGAAVQEDATQADAVVEMPKKTRPAFRSVQALRHYHVQAQDGDVGHVCDMVIATRLWRIRYLVVETSNWTPCRTVLIAPEWLDSIDWLSSTVNLGVNSKTVKTSPEYDTGKPISIEYERQLLDHYADEMAVPAD